MANPERGEVAFTVGDRVYTLVLDMNAICELEELLSTPTHPVTSAQVFVLAANYSYRHIRALVWAALRRHHKDVTLEAVGDLIEQSGGPEGFFATLKKLRGVTSPESTGRPPQARQPKRAGARTTSTRGASASAATSSGE